MKMNPSNYTDEQKQRTMDDWQRIANEGGLFYFGDGYITFFASEVATLRLFKHYCPGCIDRISQGCENQNAYYFTLEF